MRNKKESNKEKPPGNNETKFSYELFLKEALKLINEADEERLKAFLKEHEEKFDELKNYLTNLQEKQGKKILHLREQIAELQLKVIDWLPEYPVSKKIAVIFNGDSYEKRHIENTNRAIRVLKAKGFDEILVAQTKAVDPKLGVRQFGVDNAGLVKMRTYLKRVLVKDAMVFTYGTGHGSKREGGALTLDQKTGVPTEYMGVEEVKAYLSIIKDAGARIFGVFDNCHSGVFPAKLIQEAGLEGIVLSPGAVGKETYCQYFSPAFFEGLAKRLDINKDKKSTVAEIFLAAMNFYRSKVGTEAAGEFLRSRQELTVKNFDELIGDSGAPALIHLTATWCQPCKVVERDLGKTDVLFAGSLPIFKITNDTNSDAEKLYKKIGIKNIYKFPMLAVKVGGEFYIIENPEKMNGEELYAHLVERYKIGANLNYDQWQATNLYKVSLRDFKQFVGAFGYNNRYLLKYMNRKYFYKLMRPHLLEPENKDDLMRLFSKFKEKTLKEMVYIRPKFILDEYETLKQEKLPYAKEILGMAVRHLSKKAPFLVLKNLPYLTKNIDLSDEIIALIAENLELRFLPYLLKQLDEKYWPKLRKPILKKARNNNTYSGDMRFLMVFRKLKIPYKDESEILKVLAARAPRLFIREGRSLMNYFDINKYPDAKKIALTNLSLDKVLDAWDILQDEAYARSILVRLAKKMPREVLIAGYSSGITKKYPGLLRIAVESDPAQAVELFYSWKEDKDSFKLLQIAANLAPEAAVKYFDKYKSLGKEALLIFEKAKKIIER